MLSTVVITLFVLSSVVNPPTTQSTSSVQRSEGASYTPRLGSPERKAILDAVRENLDVKSQFEVGHLKVTGNWAFFRGGEVVFVEGEKHETDLSVMALLQRKEGGPGKPSWSVVEIWTLPDGKPYGPFVERLRKRRKSASFSKDIFPDDLGID